MDNTFIQAFEAYKDSTDILQAMLQYASETLHQDANFCEKGLAQFDVVLQYSLLQVCLADGCFDNNEVLFIQDIAKHGDLCKYFQTLGLTNANWHVLHCADERIVAQILEQTRDAVVQLCDDLFRIFFAVDMATPKEDFLAKMLENLSAILYACMRSDGSAEEKELTNGFLVVELFLQLKEHKDGFQSEFVTFNKQKGAQNFKDFSVKKKAINQSSKRLVDYTQKDKALAYIETDSGSGSGFMVAEGGLCFTCCHVVDGANKIMVRLPNEKNENVVYKASVKYADSGEDFAVLQLENLQNNCYYSLETDYTSLKTGDDVAVYGFPFGSALNENVMELEPSLTKGYIASRNKINGHTCYYLDIRSAPGNSGGPVFSLKTNKVIGYLCGSYGNDRANMIYIRTLQTFLKDVVKD